MTQNLAWWDDPKLVSVITERVCGKPMPTLEGSLSRFIRDRYPDLIPFKSGLSNGCGTGIKESQFLKDNTIERLMMCDVDEVSLKTAHFTFKEWGIRNRARLILADAVDNIYETFDIILWMSALHHMMDVYKALNWTQEHLKSGGVMLVFDYCGKNYLGKKKSEVTPDEAADSERIEQGLKDIFKGIQIKPLGTAYMRPLIKKGVEYNFGDVIRIDNEMLARGEYEMLLAHWRKP